MADENLQSCPRSMTEHFDVFQDVSSVQQLQPPPLNFPTKNQLGTPIDCAAQYLNFENFENRTHSEGMQQPVQALFQPQPSCLLGHSSNNQRIEFTPSTKEDLVMQDCEYMIPIIVGGPNTTTFSSGEQQPILRPFIAPLTCSPAMNIVRSEQDGTSFMTPTDNQPQPPLEVVHPVSRKRAPRVSTMSAEKWEPAESRIRQLFVDEERTYKEVMDTVNKEFGFKAR
jgi:Clr5 domain